MEEQLLETQTYQGEVGQLLEAQGLGIRPLWWLGTRRAMWVSVWKSKLPNKLQPWELLPMLFEIDFNLFKDNGIWKMWKLKFLCQGSIWGNIISVKPTSRVLEYQDLHWRRRSCNLLGSLTASWSRKAKQKNHWTWLKHYGECYVYKTSSYGLIEFRSMMK